MSKFWLNSPFYEMRATRGKTNDDFKLRYCCVIPIELFEIVCDASVTFSHLYWFAIYIYIYISHAQQTAWRSICFFFREVLSKRDVAKYLKVNAVPKQQNSGQCNPN